MKASKDACLRSLKGFSVMDVIACVPLWAALRHAEHISAAHRTINLADCS